MSVRAERLALVQAIANEPQRLEDAQNSNKSAIQAPIAELRQLNREASTARLLLLIDRLRELLPPGVTLAEYLGFNRLDDRAELRQLEAAFTSMGKIAPPKPRVRKRPARRNS